MESVSGRHSLISSHLVLIAVPGRRFYLLHRDDDSEFCSLSQAPTRKQLPWDWKPAFHATSRALSPNKPVFADSHVRLGDVLWFNHLQWPTVPIGLVVLIRGSWEILIRG